MRRRQLASHLFLATTASVIGAAAACGAIAPDADGGDDATADTVETGAFDVAFDTTLDVSSVDATDDGLDATDTTDGDADASTDADGSVYFDATPDPVGCTYFSDASCTTSPKPVSIPISGCVPSPPPQDGGIIEPGVYHLTAAYWNAQFFDGGCPTNTTWGGSLEICGNIIQDYDVNDVHSVFVGNLMYQTVGNQLELEQYCPSGPYVSSFAYTASPTQIVINWGRPTVGLIETYTKQ